MKLEWQQAPVKTQWGDEMVVASVAIDNDHTLDLYCERDQTQKVETMLTQHTWVGLTNEELRKIIDETGFGMLMNVWFDEHKGNPKKVLRLIESKLKEKNI